MHTLKRKCLADKQRDEDAKDEFQAAKLGQMPSGLDLNAASLRAMCILAKLVEEVDAGRLKMRVAVWSAANILLIIVILCNSFMGRCQEWELAFRHDVENQLQSDQQTYLKLSFSKTERFHGKAIKDCNDGLRTHIQNYLKLPLSAVQDKGKLTRFIIPPNPKTDHVKIPGILRSGAKVFFPDKPLGINLMRKKLATVSDELDEKKKAPNSYTTMAAVGNQNSRQAQKKSYIKKTAAQKAALVAEVFEATFDVQRVVFPTQEFIAANRDDVYEFCKRNHTLYSEVDGGLGEEEEELAFHDDNMQLVIASPDGDAELTDDEVLPEETSPTDLFAPALQIVPVEPTRSATVRAQLFAADFDDARLQPAEKKTQTEAAPEPLKKKGREPLVKLSTGDKVPKYTVEDITRFEDVAGMHWPDKLCRTRKHGHFRWHFMWIATTAASRSMKSKSTIDKWVCLLDDAQVMGLDIPGPPMGLSAAGWQNWHHNFYDEIEKLLPQVQKALCGGA